MFYEKISGKFLDDFNTLTLEQIFWKTKSFFKKLKYHFLVESTNVESASLTYKAAMSGADITTSRMASTKYMCNGMDYKERGFTSNYLRFLKILFQFNNLM